MKATREKPKGSSAFQNTDKFLSEAISKEQNAIITATASRARKSDNLLFRLMQNDPIPQDVTRALSEDTLNATRAHSSIPSSR